MSPAAPPRSAHGRRPPGLRHADRRRRRVSRTGVGGRRRLRHRVRQRGDPDRPVADEDRRPGRSAFGQLADEIQDVLSFGIGRKNRADDAPVGSPAVRVGVVGRAAVSASRGDLRNKARKQLGTVGSGNHYVDVFADENGRDLGRRALRQPRPRLHDRVRLSRAVAGRRSGASACPSAKCCCRSISRWARTTGP